jgi:hypothetical protein
MKKMKYYHYTPASVLEQIINSGQINLATACIPENEKPVAWVSTNPNWEHTATKRRSLPNGSVQQLTFIQQLASFGCARIEISLIGLETFAKLKHLANISLRESGFMEQRGISLGANPKEWYGSLKPIKKTSWIKAEVYMNGQWVEVQIS